VFELFVVALIAFAAGYGVRELISRRRRAAVRSRVLLKAEEFGLQERIDNLKLMAKLGQPLSKTNG
jgi:hypothetical protein